MMFSGADLIRTSASQAERLDRIKINDPVARVENPGQTQSSLEGETQNALLRFARFIKKEGQPKKSPRKPIPSAYARQAKLLENNDENGTNIDIYI